jgi:hypothetical protein
MRFSAIFKLYRGRQKLKLRDEIGPPIKCKLMLLLFRYSLPL